MNNTRFHTFCLYIWLTIALTSFSSCARPLFVTHWSASDRAFIKKNGYGYPSHNKLSVIACFDRLCLNKAEWRNKQSKNRFEGFKKKYEYHPGQHKDVPTEEVTELAMNENSQEDWGDIAINEIQSFKSIHFQFGKADIQEGSTEELDVLWDILNKHPDLKIKIMGHTDDVGSAEFNKELSLNRAKAVADYLINNGLNENRVSFQGFGSEQPLVDGEDEQARSENRRVEFLVY